MSDDQTVFLVDDEEDVRASLSMLIRSIGLKTEAYESPKAFLESYDPERPGCLVLDMRMPGMSGLQLQKELADKGLHPPIIMISGHGEIPNAVQAVQRGAVDFLQKPVSSTRRTAGTSMFARRHNRAMTGLRDVNGRFFAASSMASSTRRSPPSWT